MSPDMSPESLPAAEPEPAGMSEISRLTGVFFEPSKTFADIARRPKWLVPTLLAIVVSLVFLAVYSQRVGWERGIRQQLENNPRSAQMTAEQRERTVQMGAKFYSVGGYAAAVAGVAIYYVVVSGVLLGIVAGLLSVPVKFKQVLAVVSYANLTRVISGLLSIIVLFLKNPDDFNLQNPLAFNLGAFLDPQTTPKFLHSVAGSLDLFSIWPVLLMAIGLKASGGKRLSFGGALFAVVLPWAVWIVIRGALAGAGMAGS